MGQRHVHLYRADPDEPLYPTVRDSQRSRLYRAEERAPVGPIFPTIHDAQHFVNRVCRRKYVQENYGMRYITVVPGQGHSAHGSTLIRTYLDDCDELTLLHEVSHCLRYPHPNEAQHGWQFAATYLALMHRIMGTVAGAFLRAQFITEGVTFTNPLATGDMAV